jgi:hypothetical protein
MNSVRQQLSSATDTRLAVIISAAVDLKAQLGELNELRERVSKRAAITPKIAATETAFGPE